ncbi:STN domain-containing protein, partial [Flavobacterium zepuense]
MKLIVIFILLACFNVSASVYAQKITLQEKNAPLSRIFKKIEQQSGYSIFYENDLLKNTKEVSIHVINASLTDVLDSCFTGQPLTYTIVNHAVVVKAKEKTFIEKVKDYLKQPINIKGKIVDSLGNGLPGAIIKVKGSARATVTDNDGEFEMNFIDDNAILVITYVGYSTIEIPVKALNPSMALITMKRATSQLEAVNVVSTGYQTIPKERATGAFTQIDTKTINRNVGINILDRLEGVTSGLILNRGLPTTVGANNPKLTIRG